MYLLNSSLATNKTFHFSGQSFQYFFKFLPWFTPLLNELKKYLLMVFKIIVTSELQQYSMRGTLISTLGNRKRNNRRILDEATLIQVFGHFAMNPDVSIQGAAVTRLSLYLLSGHLVQHILLLLITSFGNT